MEDMVEGAGVDDAGAREGESAGAVCGAVVDPEGGFCGVEGGDFFCQLGDCGFVLVHFDNDSRGE